MREEFSERMAWRLIPHAASPPFSQSYTRFLSDLFVGGTSGREFPAGGAESIRLSRSWPISEGEFTGSSGILTRSLRTLFNRIRGHADRQDCLAGMDGKSQQMMHFKSYIPID